MFNKIKQKHKEKRLLNRGLNSDSEESSISDVSSASIKTTESINEARKHIENPQKIFTLLTNLRDVNLSNPHEHQEFLKILVDFEKKYGQQEQDKEEAGDEKGKQNIKKTANNKRSSQVEGTRNAGKKNSIINAKKGSETPTNQQKRVPGESRKSTFNKNEKGNASGGKAKEAESAGKSAAGKVGKSKNTIVGMIG